MSEVAPTPMCLRCGSLDIECIEEGLGTCAQCCAEVEVPAQTGSDDPGEVRLRE